MRPFAKIALTLLVLAMIVALKTGIAARAREQKTSQIRPGMHKRDIERLLGAGQPDISSPACEGCPMPRTQLVYRGNPSLWYGRLEDKFVVCYTNDVVCAIKRVGL